MNKKINKAHKLASAPQHVKILAGHWRGTKLKVLLSDELRPTPSRVRETLFNWLQPCIAGSHCLDLFAGSGALGFEAVSRGASSAILVDKDKQAVNLITQQIQYLQAKQMHCVCNDGMSYIQSTTDTFDVIFLDPPFSKYNPIDLLSEIEDKQLLNSGGMIYVEYSSKTPMSTLPTGWRWQRQSKASEVEYGLIVSD